MCSPSHSFLHIFLFTNIHNLSISLPHSLALSLSPLSPMYLSPPLSSPTFTITLQKCIQTILVSLSRSLSRSHQPPSPILLCFGCNLCLSLSPSLSLFLPHVNSHFSNMYTIPLSLSCSRFSLAAAMLTSFISTVALFLSLSLSHHLSLSLYLSSAMLTHFTIFGCGRHLPPFLSLPLSLFSHTHTHYSLLLQIRPLSVYLQLR